MDIYGKALATMGSEPLEVNETQPPRRKHGPGRGVGGGRKPGPGPRNKPRNPNGVRVAASVTLDPDIHRLVQQYAQRNGVNFSQALNDLLLMLSVS